MIIENILWDLDGTLTDPKYGIIRSIQYALVKFGRSAPPLEDLLWCIGPPLYESFAQLVPEASREDVLILVDFYRERFSKIGMYENKIYSGLPEILEKFKIEKKHFLATSKPHVFAKKILSHFQLDHYFSKIHGSELDGERSDKGDLVQYIIEMESLDPMKTVIIGDRKYDIIGGKRSGLKSIGITWGYGTVEEHTAAGADFIFSAPEDLETFLDSSR